VNLVIASSSLTGRASKVLLVKSTAARLGKFQLSHGAYWSEALHEKAGIGSYRWAGLSVVRPAP
jgi:hypothetical protein